MPGMPGTRRAGAIVCAALLVAAAILPTIASGLLAIALVPLGTIAPPAAVPLVRSLAFRCPEQPRPLRAGLDLRGPPLSPAHI